jgi:UDP-3-O-[3-hydroxymyristoyl] glucosamine N-acyltransferase
MRDEMKFSEVVQRLRVAASQSSLETQPGCDPELTGVMSVAEATPGSISFIEKAKFAAQIQTTQASALILPKDAALQATASDRGMSLGKSCRNSRCT